MCYYGIKKIQTKNEIQRIIFYENNFFEVTVIFILLVTLLASCGKSDKTKLTAEEDAAIREIFNGAYTTANYFSGYAKNVYAVGV